MAALVCDICGGKLSIGSGGIAVCDSCGMEHTKERMQEKVQEIKGTVRVDNSHLIENYLSMAQSAYDSSNQAEAESYCNKIIEIDSKNYMAWMLKGKAAGWQSSVANDRVLEASRCFLSALSFAPDEKKLAIVIETCAEVKNLCTALVTACCNNFGNYPSEDNASTLISKTNDAITMAKAYTEVDAVKAFKEFDVKALAKGGDEKASQDELTAQLTAVANIQWLDNIGGNLANIINSATVNAWQMVWREYNGEENRPSDWVFKQFIERVDVLIMVSKTAIAIEDDTSDKIQYYKNLILYSESVRDSQSWEKGFTSYGSYWRKSRSLTDQAKASRNVDINEHKAKLRILEVQLQAEKDKEARDKEEKRKDAIKKYWEAHADEKAKLDAESQSLVQQIADLNTEISNVPGKEEEANIQGRISKLKADKDALSLFKGKEKKAIQHQIDATTAEFNAVSARRNAAIEEIKRKIVPLEKRRAEIAAEFTKDR